MLDFNAEMELWTRAGHIKVQLNKGVDIRKLDHLISTRCSTAAERVRAWASVVPDLSVAIGRSDDAEVGYDQGPARDHQA